MALCWVGACVGGGCTRMGFGLGTRTESQPACFKMKSPPRWAGLVTVAIGIFRHCSTLAGSLGSQLMERSSLTMTGTIECVTTKCSALPKTSPPTSGSVVSILDSHQKCTVRGRLMRSDVGSLVAARTRSRKVVIPMAQRNLTGQDRSRP